MKITQSLLVVSTLSTLSFGTHAADFNGTLNFANLDGSPATESVHPENVVGFTKKLEDVLPLTQTEREDFTPAVASQLRYYTNSNIPFTYNAVPGSTTVTVLEPQLLGVAELLVSYGNLCSIRGLFDVSGLLTDPSLNLMMIPLPIPLDPFACPPNPVTLPERNAADIIFLNNGSGAGSVLPTGGAFPTDKNGSQHYTMLDAAYQSVLMALHYDGIDGWDGTEVCMGDCADAAKPDCAIKSITFDNDADGDGDIAIDVETPMLGATGMSYLNVMNTKKNGETNKFTPIVECHCINMFVD